MTFVSENIYAGGVSRRPRQRKALSDSETTATRSKNVDLRQETPLASRKPLQLLLPVTISIEEKAKQQFLHRYVVNRRGPLPESMWSHLCALSNLTSAETTVADSTLSFSVTAAALAFSARSQLSPSILNLAKDRYMQALGRLKIALDDATYSTSDQVLLAIMLLSNYENMTSQCNGPQLSLEGLRHMDGAKALLKVRHGRVTPQKLDGSLDRDVRAQLIRQAVYRGEVLPAWLQAGEQFGESGVTLILDRCIVRASTLRHDALQCLNTQATFANVLQVLRDAQALDEDLCDWSTDLPAEYTYEMYITPFTYHGTTSSYTSIELATVWNRYRGTRLVANCLILKLAGLLARRGSPDVQALVQKATNTAQTLVDDICSSVPFVLSDINAPASASGAFALSWPLTIAAVVPTIPDVQREWIREELRLISKITSSGIFDRVANLNLHLKNEPMCIDQLDTKVQDTH